MAIKLPEYLDNYIYNELGGEYQRVSRDDTTADVNLYNDKNANKRYIGTYFPRSLVECFTIFNELYANQIIKQTIDSKEQLRILDVGTGTGGNIVGLMYFLKKIKFPSQNVVFYTIEGNNIAIEYQIKFVNKFNSEHKTRFKLRYLSLTFNSASSLKTQLENYLNQKEFKFDIITVFKFLSEFYNADYSASQGLFKIFTDSISQYLDYTGIFLVLDIINPNTGRNFPFTTQIMSNEINEYIQSANAKLKCIIPVSCAQWSCNCRTSMCYIERQFRISHSKKTNDLSKVCYRVMVHTNFANRILSEVPTKDRYQIKHTNPEYCENAVLHIIDENINIANGFKLI